jgi:branched-chain amino acid transport system substrate-binding protein
MTSVTGADASTGGPSQFGFQLAIDDINKSGGVLVKAFNKKIPLEMDLRDNQTNPEKVMASAEQINSDGCPVAVGTTLGGIAANIFEKNKLPFVVTQFTTVGLSKAGFKYYFNTDKLNSGLSASIFALTGSLAKGSVPTKWALLEEQADWIMELVGFLKQDAAKQGITFTYEGQYQMLAPDMSQLILAAKNSGAEVIVGAPTTPDAITMLKQMLQLNYHSKAIIFYRAGDDPSWGDLGALGNYVIGSPQWTAGLNYQDPGVQALVAAWKTKSGKDGGHPSLGPAYSAVQIVAAAIEKAGSLDRNAIRDAIAAIDTNTVIGQVKFDASGVRVNAPLTVEQWQNGVMQLVWPAGPNNNIKPVIWPIP